VVSEIRERVQSLLRNEAELLSDSDGLRKVHVAGILIHYSTCKCNCSFQIPQYIACFRKLHNYSINDDTIKSDIFEHIIIFLSLQIFHKNSKKNLLNCILHFPGDEYFVRKKFVETHMISLKFLKCHISE
jgi:hypothetical protein